MFDIVLHAGTEHPHLAWVIIPSILTFIAGLSIGIYRRRIQAFFGLGSSSPSK